MYTKIKKKTLMLKSTISTISNLIKFNNGF